jgi:hypothetical protein
MQAVCQTKQQIHIVSSKRRTLLTRPTSISTNCLLAFPYRTIPLHPAQAVPKACWDSMHKRSEVRRRGRWRIYRKVIRAGKRSPWHNAGLGMLSLWLVVVH